MSDEMVRSPCISVCVLNIDDVCEGCYRTADEITAWSILSNAERRVVMTCVSERCKRSSLSTLLSLL